MDYHWLIEAAFLAIGGFIRHGLMAEKELIQKDILQSRKDIDGLGEVSRRRIDALREDVEALKSSYWSKEEQREFRHEVMDKLAGIDVKMDKILDRIGLQG